jgi:hypothetical protein
MADILEFPVRRSTSSTPSQRVRRRRAAAEIVIFPGVRYERWEEAVPAAGPAKAERDLLRLVE